MMIPLLRRVQRELSSVWVLADFGGLADDDNADAPAPARSFLPLSLSLLAFGVGELVLWHVGWLAGWFGGSLLSARLVSRSSWPVATFLVSPPRSILLSRKTFFTAMVWIIL